MDIRDKGNAKLHLCHICGRKPAAGKEHIPPRKAALNIGEVEINYIDGSAPSGTMKFHIIKSSDGFWLPSFCKDCNIKTGRRYGNVYKAFVVQIGRASGLEDTAGRVYVHLRGVYPLRIIKQMFAMFLGAVPYEPAPIWKDLQEFVRTRDNHLPPGAPSVYLYKNISRLGRIVPCCGIVELSTHKTLVVSEISWPPLGIVFSFQTDKRFEKMENVTHWGQFPFEQQEDFLVRLPKLQVTSHYPLAFGTVREVNKEQARRMPLYLFHVPRDSSSRADVGVLWKRMKQQVQ